MSISSETVKEFSPEMDFSGGYEDCQLLWESAQSRLYRASRCGKHFLLKAAKSDAGPHLAMLKREYELSVGCIHPNIVHVFLYEPDSPVGPCIVMEYVDGRTMREFLEEGPSLKRRRKVLEQLVGAVSYLHSKGIIHNDLKPDNVLVSRDGDEVRLIDFGLADNDAHYLVKSPGYTPYYSSPELRAAARGENVTVSASSDVFSLGMIIREMFAGPGYAGIMRKCLKVNPSKRYENATALMLAIGRRKRIPAVLGGVVMLGAVCLAVVLTGVRMHRLREDVARYEQAGAEKQAVTDSLNAVMDSLNTVMEERSAEYEKAQQDLSVLQAESDARKQAEQDRLDRLAAGKKYADQYFRQRLDPLLDEMLTTGSRTDANAVWQKWVTSYQDLLDYLSRTDKDIQNDLTFYVHRLYNDRTSRINAAVSHIDEVPLNY